MGKFPDLLKPGLPTATVRDSYPSYGSPFGSGELVFFPRENREACSSDSALKRYQVCRTEFASVQGACAGLFDGDIDVPIRTSFCIAFN